MGPATEIDGGDLQEPTRPSFSVAVPLASDFDEVPPAQVLNLHREPTVKLEPDAEAATVLRKAEVGRSPGTGGAVAVRRSERRRRVRTSRVRGLPFDLPVLDTATKSGLAGLLVGLLILVPITLLVLWSSY